MQLQRLRTECIYSVVHIHFCRPARPYMAFPWATCCPYGLSCSHFCTLIFCTGALQCIPNRMYVLNFAQPLRGELYSRKASIACPVAHATPIQITPNFIPTLLGVCCTECIYSNVHNGAYRNCTRCAPPPWRTFSPTKRPVSFRSL